ncbi:hypothetical protein NY08_2394 [Rhodococcus sp. B7740]|nr:hypothetical protein NY08_2394 [Rhodococcus sp. B7740]
MLDAHQVAGVLHHDIDRLVGVGISSTKSSSGYPGHLPSY